MRWIALVLLLTLAGCDKDGHTGSSTANGPPSEIATTPEPGSLTLLVSGLVCGRWLAPRRLRRGQRKDQSK